MKKFILAGLAAASLGAVIATPAEARDGCGIHRYRAWNGRCYWMQPVPPPPPVYQPPVYFGFGFGGGGGPWGWHRGWHHWR